MDSKTGLRVGLAGIAVTGITLAGCTSSAPHLQNADDPALVMHSPGPATGSEPSSGSESARGSSQSAASTGKATPASPKTRQGAQAAATRFTQLYYSKRYADSWNLLAGDARQVISRSSWTDVHNACTPHGANPQKRIASVVLFGESAIITQAASGTGSASAKDTYVLSYVNGQWAISPDDIATYQRGSVAADVAAAKAAGFCGNWKVY
jgi:hypothetical protein